MTLAYHVTLAGQVTVYHKHGALIPTTSLCLLGAPHTHIYLAVDTLVIANFEGYQLATSNALDEG